MDNLLWQHLKTLPAFRALLRAVEARFYHQFDIPGPVLDLGCGDGDFASHTFNEFGQKIDVGLDPWIGPLTKSVKRNVYGDGAMQAMGDKMPLPSEHFNAVISNSVLEHIPDVTSVLVEAGRVLKQDGVFLMTMPNHRFTKMMWGALFFERFGLDGLAERYRTLFNFVSRHQHTEPVEWWADQLAQGGMVVERWQYYFSPAALHTLEFGHVQGLPSAIMHLFTGKWIIAPTKESLGITERWVRPYYLEQADLDGCYQFILARKVSNGPIVAPPLPPAEPFEVDPRGDLIPSESESPTIDADQIQAAPLNLSSQQVEPANQEDLFKDEESQVEKVMPSMQAWFGVMAGTLLSLISFFLTDGRGANRPWLGIVLWLIATGVAAYGLSGAIQFDGSRFAKLKEKLSFKNIWLPVALFMVAWLIRAWQLTSHPWIISGTEAAFGLERAFISAGIQSNPFGTDGLTNPLLPFFFTAFTESLFGPSVLALRVLSPIIGAATVALTFAVGRRFWGLLAGLAGAILLLGSHTHIHFSRLGLTNIWDPLLMLASAALVVVAWRKKERLAWLAAGFASGLSFYFFTAGHLLPAILPLLVATIALTDELKAIWADNDDLASGLISFRSLLAGLTLAIITMMPLLMHYFQNPGRFGERLARQGVVQSNWILLQQVNTGLTPRQIWLAQIFDSLSFFSLGGAADRSTYYGNPIGLITILPTILLIVGAIYAVIKIKQHANQMLFWILIVTVFGAGILLTYPPQSHRYLVMLPVLSLFGGIGIQQLAIWSRKWLKIESDTLVILWVLVLAAGSVAPDVGNYFIIWQSSREFTDKNSEIAFEIAQTLNSIPRNSTVYLQTAPDLTAGFPTIGYLAPQYFIGQNLVDLPAMNGTVPDLSKLGPTVFVLLPDRNAELKLLQESFPAGKTEAVNGFFADPLFFVFNASE